MPKYHNMNFPSPSLPVGRVSDREPGTPDSRDQRHFLIMVNEHQERL
jgi:hypothetical protein